MKIRQFQKRLILSVIALGSCAVMAAPVRFMSVTEVDGLKLSVPLLSGAREIPMKPVEVFRYMVSRGDVAWIEDRNMVRDLWVEPQFVSSWEDERKNTQTLLMMALVSPKVDGREQVTREVFTNQVSSVGYLDQQASLDDLSEWVKFYTNDELLEAPRTLRLNTSRIAKMLEFKVLNSSQRVYAFRLNPRYPGQAQAAAGWFALVFNFVETPDRNVDQFIHTQVLSKLSAALGTGTFRTLLARKKRIESRFATPVQPGSLKARMRRSVAYLLTWWYMESPNYILLSDNWSAEAFARTLMSDLEAMRQYYAKVLPKFDLADDETGVVRLFDQEEDYVSYLSEANMTLDAAQTGGVYSGMRRELVIRPTSTMTAEGDGSIRSIIRHEGFHQYVFTATGGITPSAWYNEGYATFFEHSKVDRSGRFVLKESDRYTAVLENLLDHPDNDWEKALQSLLYMDYATFYSQPDVNYSVGYGLIYFLTVGAPMLRNQPYADILPTYLKKLEQTGNPAVATQAAFERVDMRQFARSFVDFWNSTQARQTALRNPGL